MNRESLRKACDVVVDGGKRGLASKAPPRTIAMLRPLAAEIPPFATVAVAHGLLDDFFAGILPLIKHPFILVTVDHPLHDCHPYIRPMCRSISTLCKGMSKVLATFSSAELPLASGDGGGGGGGGGDSGGDDQAALVRRQRRCGVASCGSSTG